MGLVYIYLLMYYNQTNVGKYAIHGSYGSVFEHLFVPKPLRASVNNQHQTCVKLARVSVYGLSQVVQVSKKTHRHHPNTDTFAGV